MMTDKDRFERNHQRLDECNTHFGGALASVILKLQQLGWRPRIQCAWRSPADQAVAVASGHSQVGFSFHMCSTLDGQPDALAADVLDDDSPVEPRRGYLLALARLARANGLQTGILWGLDEADCHVLGAAIDSGATNYSGRLGWDPTHVEWVGLTLAQAKAGVRPTGEPLNA